MGQRYKPPKCRTNKEVQDYIKWVITRELMIPSMVDKLPMHIYDRLECIEAWVARHGWDSVWGGNNK